MVIRSRGPDATLWATCQYSTVFRSQDGGRTFAVLDDSKLVAATDPAYYPTRAFGTPNDGATFGVDVGSDGVVYVGTETAGAIYSADFGASFHPVDYDYTNPMSKMARLTHCGNVGGVGVLNDGRILFQGAPYRDTR